MRPANQRRASAPARSTWWSRRGRCRPRTRPLRSRAAATSCSCATRHARDDELCLPRPRAARAVRRARRAVRRERPARPRRGLRRRRRARRPGRRCRSRARARTVGADVLIGLSTHSPAQVDAASARTPTTSRVGPVYATPTKPGARAGRARARALRRRARRASARGSRSAASTGERRERWRRPVRRASSWCARSATPRIRAPRPPAARRCVRGARPCRAARSASAAGARAAARARARSGAAHLRPAPSGGTRRRARRWLPLAPGERPDGGDGRGDRGVCARNGTTWSRTPPASKIAGSRPAIA